MSTPADRIAQVFQLGQKPGRGRGGGGGLGGGAPSGEPLKIPGGLIGFIVVGILAIW